MKRQGLLGGFVRAFSIDYRSLALLRISLGLIILADLAMRSQYFVAFFTDQGILPRDYANSWYGDGTWSLYFINGGPWFSGFLVGLSVLAALCLVAGYRTRLATIISWILLVSLQQRTAMLSSGADDLMRLLLFWGMFLPLGARASIDAALVREPVDRQSHFDLATIGILMQAMYVYWVGALLKTGDAWNTDYTAVAFALNAEHYSTQLGQWVLENFAFLLQPLTFFVVNIEQYGPLFILAPVALLWFRLPVLLLLIGMHIGFLLLLNVGHFPYVSITSLLLFLPTEIWDRIARSGLGRRAEGLTVFYDQSCDFCLKTVLILRSVLILPQLDIRPAQPDPVAGPLLEQHDSWVLRRPDGTQLLEWSALCWLLARSPWLFWLAWPARLLQWGGLGNRAYHWIGDRRVRWGQWSARFWPWGEAAEAQPQHWMRAVFLLFALGFVAQINLAPVWPKVVPDVPTALAPVRSALGLWQKWDMFAPYPIARTEWPVFEGFSRSAKPIDVYNQRWGPVDLQRPDNILATFPYYRWRKYYGRLYLRKYSYLRAPYVRYECRRWNAQHAAGEQLQDLKLFMYIENTKLDGSPEPRVLSPMGEYKC